MGGNAEQRAHWNEVAGPAWVAHQERLDAQILPFGELVLAQLAPAPGERILDVGCGCGATSLELGRRVGSGGEVLGVDISAPMIARARECARAEGLDHVTFLQADAQSEALPHGRFDAVFSRFGVMFFEDPETAFRNLRAALAPGGRLGFVCWQAPSENPWITVPMAAAAPFLAMPPPPPEGAPGMFQLADPRRIEALLEAAGFSDVAVRGERPELALAARDPDEAADFFLEIGPLGSLLREQDPTGAKRGRLRAALREALAPRGDGPLPTQGSAVWVVGARNPAGAVGARR